MDHRLDVLIVGSGLVGGSMACALAQGGLKVGLIDPKLPEKTATQDPRMSAIAYGSYQFLKHWGILSHLNNPPEPILEIHTSQAGTYGRLSYTSEEIGGDPLGYMIPNRELRLAVMKQTQTFANLQRFIPDRIQQFNVTPRCVEVALESGIQLEASLLIVADGKQSTLREQLGISCIKRDYHQQGVIFNLKCGVPHHNRAYEHFMPEGPLAVLPMPDQCVSVVWTQTNACADRLLNLSPQRLIQAFQSRFGYGLGKLELASTPIAYPLSLILPKEMIRPRIALIGDAAHSIHPVAGQGVNVGFRDNHRLAELLLEYKTLGLDLGGETLLKTYRNARRYDVWSMAGITHGLVHLFSRKEASVRTLRKWGMQAVEQLPPLKRFLINHARGLSH